MPAPFPEADGVTRTAADWSLTAALPGDDARFAPGQVFARRYRIVSPLGRGAMGEVYRADDLRLGQRVALKLLGPDVPGRTSRLERFVSEVRLARGIAHPNVCRVYDIGTAEGWHYLSMEYVDGETLASLLRRIGRLPTEKALDVAHQLCQGLAAAHERGVLHRDVKPSNIMIDGAGRVRLMDFGLAVPVTEAQGHDGAGTPAYMAPEQIAGSPVTERTDIYALGLVIRELFTGRSAAATAPPIPAAVDAVIRSCLQSSPALRPSSALDVAAALPGDAIAAAVAQGRLLAPEVIAAAAMRGTLRPVTAWLICAAVVALTVAMVPRIPPLNGITPATLPKPPEVLLERARQVVANIGGTSDPVDSEAGFAPVSAGDGTTRGITFQYRQSPAALVPANAFHQITATDPPLTTPGMALVTLDAAGSLLQVYLVPGAGASATRAQPDWAPLFRDAGLNIGDFAAAPAVDTVFVPHDTVVAWQPTGHADAHRPIAATLNGRPVYFDASGGLPPVAASNGFTTRRAAVAEAGLWIFVIVAFGAAAVSARSNLRRGDGDIAGAYRLAILVFVAATVSTVLRAHHVRGILEEMPFIFAMAGWSAMWAAFVWTVYVGAEPAVRRHWPHVLVGWTRLLAGRFTDPQIGRELLIGLANGLGLLALHLLQTAVAPRDPLESFAAPALESVTSVRHFIVIMTFNVIEAAEVGVAGLFLFVVIYRIVKDLRVAILLLALVAGPVMTGVGHPSLVLLAFMVAAAYWAGVVLTRCGLLAYTVCLLVRLTMTLPVTLDADAWYAGYSWTIIGLLIALSLYAAVISSAGRGQMRPLALGNP